MAQNRSHKKNSRMTLQQAHTEALRYMSNAEETLKKAGKDRANGNFADVKYVKTAAGTAYSGVLLALDAWLQQQEGAKFKKPKSIDDYRVRLAKQNKKLLGFLNNVYDELHLLGYYHGTTSPKLLKIGFEHAYTIIDFIK